MPDQPSGAICDVADPTVSVICPVFDAAPEHLRAAARAVLDEPSGLVRQLILVDDRSTRQDTADALLELSREPRVVVLRAAVNGGPARARNIGIAAATGDWIGFTDADDLWLPGRLAVLRTVLDAAPGAQWAASRHVILHDDGASRAAASLAAALPGEPAADGVVRLPSPASTRALAGDYWLHLGGCLVRAALLRRLGGFDEACLYSEDWLLFLRLSACTDLYYADAPAYALRRQHASLTTSGRRLTGRRLDGKRAALRDPLLAPFRRELRWALISTLKGLAASNLVAGRRWRAARFAAWAYLTDPREVAALRVFAGLLRLRDRDALRARVAAYSRAEIASDRPGRAPDPGREDPKA